MDIANVRAEIKKWERDFRSEHGREPSVQEIKAQPAIAAKYKLYKTLSKAAASFSKAAGPSTTPPPGRSQSTASIVPKSRAIKVDPPLSTSNPFSPVKNRKKLPDQPSSSQRASNPSRPNPFATPSKPKRSLHVTRRSPSPDPFPPILPLPSVQRPLLSPTADSAVTRARKRLRGEPVSPSPVKEKRSRVIPHAAPSFPGRPPRPPSPEPSYPGDGGPDPNDTIIADTPMKPLRSGRSFKVLFDDTSSNTEPPSMKISSRKKSDSPPPGFRGMKRDRSRALTPSSDEDEDWAAQPKLRSLEASAAFSAKPPNRPKARTVNGKQGVPKAFVPTSDNLWSDLKSSSQAKPSPVVRQSQSALPDPPSRAPGKRALPDDLDDVIGNGSTGGGPGLLELPLIPPSPPPESSTSARGRGKPAPFGRKKAKLLQEAGGADGEDEDDVEVQVREIDPRARIPADPSGDAHPNWEVDWRARSRPEQSAFLDDASAAAGKFEVDLPDDLHRILAISPDGQARETGEEKVVRSLLYGSREVHYDPSKGGEIWDVGEDSEYGGDTDDWEGEPVPWETGEL